MKYLEICVRAPAESVESLAELFHEHGEGGVSLEQVAQPVGEDGLEPVPGAPVAVRTYLPLDERTPARRQQLEEALWYLSRLVPFPEPEFSEVDEADWANAWKEHFHVQRLTRRLTVRPTWREHTPAPAEVVIDLDPGMAFGTGLHPTTHLCLAALDERLVAGSRVLDLGTGSGILAIAAAKLGAGEVVALDIDPVAVSAARENVARNGVADRIRVGAGSAAEAAVDQPFDLVLANILAGVIIDLAPSLLALIAPGGELVASGIIDERAAAVLDALRAAGFAVVDVRAEGDWRAIVARPSAA